MDEADRLIREADSIDTNSSIEEIEKRLKEYKHDSLYYYNCGTAVANVINNVKLNKGNDALNAAIDGLVMFEDLIDLSSKFIEK